MCGSIEYVFIKIDFFLQFGKRFCVSEKKSSSNVDSEKRRKKTFGECKVSSSWSWDVVRSIISNLSTTAIFLQINTSQEEEEVDLPTNVDENVASNDVDSDGDDEASENESEISSSEEMPEKDDVNHIPGEKPRYRVKITAFVSPNLFYVSLVGQLAPIQKYIN